MFFAAIEHKKKLPATSEQAFPGYQGKGKGEIMA